MFLGKNRENIKCPKSTSSKTLATMFDPRLIFYYTTTILILLYWNSTATTHFLHVIHHERFKEKNSMLLTTHTLLGCRTHVINDRLIIYVYNIYPIRFAVVATVHSGVKRNVKH